RELHDASRAATADGDETAAAFRLMLLTGMRPGGDADTGADAKAYGATTLPKSAVTVRDDVVHYDFIGKKNVRIVGAVEDATLARMVEARLADDDEDRLFRTTAAKANTWLKALAGSDFKCKDLRTLRANTMAASLVAEMPVPTTDEERRSAVNSVADAV